MAHILYIIKFSVPWKQLGENVYNIFYKHFIKLNESNIFKNTYMKLLNIVIVKNNKRGIDCKRNK